MEIESEKQRLKKRTSGGGRGRRERASLCFGPSGRWSGEGEGEEIERGVELRPGVGGSDMRDARRTRIDIRSIRFSSLHFILLSSFFWDNRFPTLVKLNTQWTIWS